MCNSRPGYRGGWALALQAEGIAPAKESVLSLDRDEAVGLGRAIIKNEAKIAADFVERFFAAYPEDVSEFCDRGGDARLDFSHGVIIDLENMFFKTANFQHRIRLCLTVCQHGKKSKIWFRSECVGYLTAATQEWTQPIELSEDDLARFFAEAEQMSDVALNELQRLYGERLQMFSDEHLEGATATLYLAEQFEFKTFDSDSVRLCDLFFDLKKGATFTEWVKDRLETDARDAETAVMTMNLAIPDELPAMQTLMSMRNNPDVSIIDHASIDGELGVFIKRLTTSPDRSLPKASYVGAAFDPTSYSTNRRYGDTPAFRLSAEMLARVTSRL